jgi:hypothetical protein
VVDLDCYLQAVFAVLNASANGRPSIFHLAHVLWRHRDTQLMAVPAPAIQRIVCRWFCLSGDLGQISRIELAWLTRVADGR